MNSILLQRKTITPLQWGAVLIGFSVPITVVADNLLLALILLGALFNIKGISRVAASHPVARTAILLLSTLFIAMFYGLTPLKDAFIILMKYIDLLFIPIFIYLFSNNAVRKMARYAFVLAMTITLVASYLLWMNILPILPGMDPGSTPTDPSIFRSHITQSNMMAFAVLLSLLEYRDSVPRNKKIALALFALLGSINILFMVQGRAGYLILLAALGWFTWSTLARAMHKNNKIFTWKQKAFLLLSLLIGATLTYEMSPHLHNRVSSAITEYQARIPGQHTDTSIGERLEFYTTALQIIKEKPLFGVGTGGLPTAYAQHSQGISEKFPHGIYLTNPHNEFLMISVQTGFIGLSLLLFLFYTLWRYAPLLPTAFEQDAARGLVLAYLISSSVCSSLLDHADGLFFAFMVGLLFSNLQPNLGYSNTSPSRK
jgi:O-antigen ligase